MEKSTQNFANIKYQKKVLNLFFLSVILMASAFTRGKNYYTQVILEERKYVVKQKRMTKYITDDIDISSGSDRKDSEEGDSDEKNSVEENFAEDN